MCKQTSLLLGILYFNVTLLISCTVKNKTKKTIDKIHFLDNKNLIPSMSEYFHPHNLIVCMMLVFPNLKMK